MYRFNIEVDREYSNEIQNLLKQEGVGYRLYVRKALGFPEVVMITAASLNIIDIIRRWIKEKRKQGTDVKVKMYRYDETNITNIGEEIRDFENKSLEEIEIEIKK